MRKIEIYLIIALLPAICFAIIVNKADLKALPLLTGDEKVVGEVIPYKGGRQSPGEQIGYTTFDHQANGTFGQRLALDDLNQVHVDWMYCPYVYPRGTRFIQWNFRYADGSWYGAADAAPEISGYCQLDVTRDANPDSQRSVIACHWDNYSWINIDKGNGWGYWTWYGQAKTPGVYEHIWPYICVASNNNIVMVTGNSGSDMNWHHLYLTTDEGETWTHIADFDSCTCLSQFVRASHNPGSQKVVYVWTQSIAMDFLGLLISQMACDIRYMLSTDNGVTWSTPVNITNFLPPGQMVNSDSTPWAYCDVNAVFDKDDNLHIAFGASLGYMLNDTIYYMGRAKIFHWDEVSDTLTEISSPSIYYDEPGGWWLDISAGFPQHTDPWRLPVDRPQLIVDPDDYLFCIWHGQDDTTDYSAAGWFNGELYGSYSTDNGITWSDYVNLTNTRSPGADSGDCFDEDYMTAYPYIVNDSIYLTYIEDKDAGPIWWTNIFIDNPVRCWVFHKDLITGIEEEESSRPEYALPFLKVYPNPFSELTNVSFSTGLGAQDVALKIYDATGRLVRDFSLPTAYSLLPTTISWDGTDDAGRKLPAGVYFIELKARDRAVTEKIVKLH